MAWTIDSEPRPGADRIHAHWTGNRSIYDAALLCGDGVDRTSVGGSARAELARGDKPLVGVFRWEENVERPVAVLSWRSELDGPERTEEIELG